MVKNYPLVVNDFIADGNHLFITTRHGDLLVYETSAQSSLRLVDTWHSESPLFDVIVQSQLAHVIVAAGEEGAYLLNISDSSPITTNRRLPTSGNIMNLAIEEDMLYVGLL